VTLQTFFALRQAAAQQHQVFDTLRRKQFKAAVSLAQELRLTRDRIRRERRRRYVTSEKSC
jgi:hypothetical protein